MPNWFVTIDQQPLNGYYPQCTMPHDELQWTSILHIIMKHISGLRFSSKSNNNITTNQFETSNYKPLKCALSYNKPHNGPMSYTLQWSTKVPWSFNFITNTQKPGGEEKTFSQMGTMDGGDVNFWQNQRFIWSLLGDTLIFLGFGQTNRCHWWKVVLAHPIHRHMLSGELSSFRPPFFFYTRNYGLKR